jgi:hypothetical protein
MHSAIRIKFDVIVDGIIVARLRIPLAINRSHDGAAERQDVTVDSARSAFASYASPDRARVLDRVASVRTATGMDIWMDCINLRPNDHWRELLGLAIETRDLFLLFWSRDAFESQWVEWEWRAAPRKEGARSHAIASARERRSASPTRAHPTASDGSAHGHPRPRPRHAVVSDHGEPPQNPRSALNSLLGPRMEDERPFDNLRRARPGGLFVEE